MGLSFKNTILGRGAILLRRDEGAEAAPPLSKPGQWQGFKGLGEDSPGARAGA